MTISSQIDKLFEKVDDLTQMVNDNHKAVVETCGKLPCAVHEEKNSQIRKEMNWLWGALATIGVSAFLFAIKVIFKAATPEVLKQVQNLN